ncbi:MAG: DUF6624 domain-containing protein [Hyphomonadaceae bacterium]
MRLPLICAAVWLSIMNAAAETPSPSEFAARVRSGELAAEQFDFAANGFWPSEATTRAQWRDATVAELVEGDGLSQGCAIQDVAGIGALAWVGLAESALDDASWRDAARALRIEFDALNTLAEARANGRRDSAARQSSAGRYMDALGDAPSGVAREALQRVIRDQTFRAAYISPPPRLPTLAREQWQTLVGAKLTAIDCDNTAWLEQQLSSITWFDIPTFGRRVDNAAWLIAQHADRSPELQHLVLQRLEALSAGATNLRNVAFLWDRVAVAEGRPQRYGTQIHCRDGALQALNGVENEALIDDRRAEMGLPSWEQYWTQMRGALSCAS